MREYKFNILMKFTVLLFFLLVFGTLILMVTDHFDWRPIFGLIGCLLTIIIAGYRGFPSKYVVTSDGLLVKGKKIINLRIEEFTIKHYKWDGIISYENIYFPPLTNMKLLEGYINNRVQRTFLPGIFIHDMDKLDQSIKGRTIID